MSDGTYNELHKDARAEWLKETRTKRLRDLTAMDQQLIAAKASVWVDGRPRLRDGWTSGCSPLSRSGCA